jgi:hypothetical protein
MARKFNGKARGRIRALKKWIKSIQNGDAAEAALATKQHRLPILFTTGAPLDAALQTLLDRANAALRQS